MKGLNPVSNCTISNVDAEATVYETVGGQPFFDELVDRFYTCVETKELIRPMYPEIKDAPRVRLAGFLAQYWGGPAHYSSYRGHPRLRFRHKDFSIGAYERNAWLECMLSALNSMEIPENIRQSMSDYFKSAATSLINTTYPLANHSHSDNRKVIPLRE